MRILLDTQCWLWMSLAPERFGARARRLVEAQENLLYFSAASAWEIAIKHALGKLRLPQPPVTYVPARVTALGVQPLPLTSGTHFRSRHFRSTIVTRSIAC